MRQIIGITCPWSVETWGDSFKEGGYYYVGKPYVEAVYKSGGLPFLIPPQYDDKRVDDDLDKLADMLDGILFTGGGSAKRFKPEELPSLREQQKHRYDFEKKLMEKAYKVRMPAIGICRGFQMMIETFGGSLADKTINGHKQDIPAWKPYHTVSITKNSKLYDIIKQEFWEVNSLHIQRVHTIPKGFIVSAKTEDKVVESVEAEDYPFFMGFQFHPEYLLYEDERAKHIFDFFIKETKRYKQAKFSDL